jgi:Flp pilus assembly protein TadG
MLMGLLDLGRAYYTVVALKDAAEEGAAYAAIAPTDEDGIKERAADASGELITVDTTAVSVTMPALAGGEPITVTVSYNFEFYTPLAGPILPEGGLTLRGQATHSILN